MAETKRQSDRAETPSRRNCGTMEVHERLLRTVAGYREARDASENHALRAMLIPGIGRTGCTRIPVVVHVVHKTAAQNISDAQIQSQIDVLNADFRRKNADIGSVPAPFQPLTADSRIEFALATTDPNGQPSTGITRTQTSRDSFGDNDDVKSAASGGADAWPADRYLNIWVCQLGGGLLGYAQFPGGPAATDGVVILHSAFGTSGTAAAPFDLGRTTTHEVGHWLNLRHIWGDDGTGCAGDDFVTDTPNQGGPNYGAPTFPSTSCNNGPNGDLFMNYMDYVDDVAMVMFTAGQVARMQATLDGQRSSIGSAIPCGGKPIPKEHPKDHPKETIKEFVKESPKDIIKDNPKEIIKDTPKDRPKDFIKETIKDNIKEFHKDPPKDIPKDHKEWPKELGKDHFEPPKHFFEPPKPLLDPPKQFFEPPKTLVEGPVFPGGGIGPIAGGGIAPGGGMPFVLATPTGPAAGPPMTPSMGLREPAAQLASSYQKLLMQYARLYARGALDTEGLASWLEAQAMYQQLQGQ